MIKFDRIEILPLPKPGTYQVQIFCDGQQPFADILDDLANLPKVLELMVAHD